MPPLVDDRRIDLFGIEIAHVRIGGAFGSGGGILPERSDLAAGFDRGLHLRSASDACLGSLPTKPSITLRWRSTAARSSCAELRDVDRLGRRRSASAPRFEQRRDRVGAIAAGGEDQRRLFPLPLPCALTSALASASRLITSALPDEAARCSGVAPLWFDLRVDVGAGLDQRLGHRRTARLGGEVERRVLADARHRADVGAGVHQHARRARRRRARRPSAARVMPSPCARVDVGALLEQLLARRPCRRARPRRPRRATCCALIAAVMTSAITDAVTDASSRSREIWTARSQAASQCRASPTTRYGDRRRRGLRERQFTGAVAERLHVVHAEHRAPCVRNALAIGVASAALMCRLPLSAPLPWPRRISGQRRWLWTFGSAIGEPHTTIVFSSRFCRLPATPSGDRAGTAAGRRGTC